MAEPVGAVAGAGSASSAGFRGGPAVEGPVARGAAKRSCLAARLAASSDVRPAAGMLGGLPEGPEAALAFFACSELG